MLLKGEFAERGLKNLKVIMEKTSTTDDEGRFRPGFCRRLWSTLSHPSSPWNESRSDATSLKRLEHGMKENTSKPLLTYSLFPARNLNSIILALSKFPEPVIGCHVIRS